jgi:predicted RecB family nuclease
MEKLNKKRFSPSDLVTFLGCHHATYLDLKRHSDGIKPTEDSASNKLLQEKGYEHEKGYLQSLKDEGRSIIEISSDQSSHDRIHSTIEVLRSGVDVIYQARLDVDPWFGNADFLMKTNLPSELGQFSYEVLDTKLSKTPETKHIMQLCVYSDLLEKIQGVRPKLMHLVLGDRTSAEFKVDDFFHYYQKAKLRFEVYVNNPPASSYPEPCNHCQLCHWRDRCTDQWQNDDHLNLVANIQRSQIDKLLKAGIRTVADLSALPVDLKIEELNQDVFLRLRSQATLQDYKRCTNQNKLELLEPGPTKGFERLPLSDKGDLFFDMEGDPLYPGGLEYLFGLYYLAEGRATFLPFWGHNSQEERLAFEQFMAFLDQHLSQYPNAHIYHYNHYETTALKRLAGQYATCTEQLDNLLRQNKFVDLYKVVRESIRTSEPGYSIKNLETFYMEKRENAVATAMDSIIVYNRWRKLGDDTLLQEIADYNEVDCVSTARLRDWLITLRPHGMGWFKNQAQEEASSSLARKEWEVEYEKYHVLLTVGGDDSAHLRQRILDLLEFHNREAKPQYWAMFERQDKFEDELIADNDCIGGLVRFGEPEEEKSSFVYDYHFPAQEYKLRIGDSAVDTASLQTVGTIFNINEDERTVRIKRSKRSDAPPERLSIGPGRPIDAKSMRAAIYSVADSIIEGSTNRYQAIKDILNKSLPRIQGKSPGIPLITSGELQKEALEIINNLDNSYLFIQGPPGAGKTYTSSHIIVELMRRGKKIGVAANAHKAIHNLLDKIEAVAADEGFQFEGVKKASKGSIESYYDGACIKNVEKTEALSLNENLVAGTAWFFSNEYLKEHLDYLFIDEAGQVALANVVAMGTAAKNIILIGDQMQLGQPIQGTHPGEAGLSILDFLLGDHATIPPERGIFLDNTRRMRPSVCQFISEAFYEGRLHAHESTSQRSLVFDGIGIPEEGIHIIEATHEGCSQKSIEEGAIIKSLYQLLLKQQFKENGKAPRALTRDDILVVTPYNVQVNYLRSILPEGAKVGTVDKFQGQEAPVVLVSMVTSSAEDLPRNIEFLYSKNRLNVAISRAQCLSVVVMNPNLVEVPCKTVEQMKLVNTFCWLTGVSG